MPGVAVDTTPAVALRRPVSEVARVVCPVTFNVPVAVMLEAVRFALKKPLPATERRAKGEVVPIPKLPESVRRARSAKALLVNMRSGEDALLAPR